MAALYLVLLLALVLVEWRATVLEWRASDWPSPQGGNTSGARRRAASTGDGATARRRPIVGQPPAGS